MDWSNGLPSSLHLPGVRRILQPVLVTCLNRYLGLLRLWNPFGIVTTFHGQAVNREKPSEGMFTNSTSCHETYD